MLPRKPVYHANTGRVRLQKAIYLLEKLGLGGGFKFVYHHYGPYSEDLTRSADYAQAFSLMQEETGHRSADGARFSVFKVHHKPEQEAFGKLEPQMVRELMQKFAGTNVTVLELAATAYWLQYEEHRDDWRDEIVRRKGVKTENGRLEKALRLLDEIGLAA